MKKPQILACLLVLGFGVVALFVFGGAKNDVGEQGATGWSIFSESQTDEGERKEGSDSSGVSSSSEPERVENTSSGSYDFGESIRYVNTAYGFSFDKPTSMDVSSFTEDMGETILIQEAKGSAGFQIFILPWDEQEYTVMTVERIREDLPDFTIREPQEVVLADGTHALLFWSEEKSVGRTREVWIIKNEYLYQISALAHFDPLLARVMSSWRFE
ncbi:MAG: hypothetical protein G01um101448_351 [Parcubacteria group bacterium Gr01-1014_48]|nr:MAG: hypothetical protein Greene041614_256 [Parcubacteria group bacterium Greene0416_14]TSC74048.1 MAG: hypothetical protein G01um101448_351 [Parcubacteria group bacterium Gr01-1014_48]TSD01163.1 MAG: hypothetical protein Greene101415_466 [Parcubacteria group bacterium Greene1014_15]TSD08239.1 MAG: hypothetical protein Greene07144_309 [Parcubacteria group bacterium Greene0714_4]